MTTIFYFIKNTLHLIKMFIINHQKSVIAVALIVILFFIYKAFSSSGGDFETIRVSTGSVTQMVKVTGPVKAVSEAEMSFEKSAPVAYVGVKVGENVYAGKVLASVSSGDERANLMQTRASLDNARAVLDQLRSGARQEELAVKEQAVSGAKNNLETAYSSLPDSIHNADAITVDIVKNKLSSMYTYAGSRYILSFSSCDQTLQSVVEQKRSNIENDLANFQKSASVVSAITSTEDIDKAFALSYDVTVKTNDLISSISNLLLASCSTSNSSLDAYRTNLSSARTSLNTLFTDLASKRSSLISAKNNLAVAERDYLLTKAGTDPNKIKAQEAVVAESEAKVLNSQVQIAKTQIVAPFDGVVTDVSLTQGEVASLGKTVIKLISSNSFEIEAKVPEVDIAKISVGNIANISLDTYGTGVIFEGVVSRINPSAENSGNVPMYKVIISFKKQDARIRSGMTSNISIITSVKENVLKLPIRFVKTNADGTGVVDVKTEKGTEERVVKVGIMGADGNLEIISGLSKDEEVVAIQPGERSAQKTNN